MRRTKRGKAHGEEERGVIYACKRIRDKTSGSKSGLAECKAKCWDGGLVSASAVARVPIVPVSSMKACDDDDSPQTHMLEIETLDISAPKPPICRAVRFSSWH